ncbi:hypothetical protein J4463_03165 [Candidatus Pacearchaeota archaeon]|nr:hypothetical protein [Candidatus Pacearchaeota archaeon]
MEHLKIALHEHGTISFAHDWEKYQKFNPETLLKDFADACFSRGIDICAVTSEYWEIPRGFVQDRLGYLAKQIDNMPLYYRAEKLGNNMLVVEQKTSGKKLYLVSGQTAIVAEPIENGKKRRLDHLVVGTNQVPNLRSLKDTINYCHDNGLISIAEHPTMDRDFSLGGSGMDKSTLLTYWDKLDAIEGHNSMVAVPNWLGFLPKLGEYTRTHNKQVQAFAEKHGKPWVAISDSHRLKDIGLSYIKCSQEDIDFSDEEKLLSTLKQTISNGQFIPVANYSNMLGWIQWTMQFMKGNRAIRDSLDDKYQPSSNSLKRLVEY